MMLALYVLGLVAVWVLAWGSLSFANVLGGLAVAAVVLWVAPDTWAHGGRVRLRPVAVARFAGYVVVQVVVSNVVLIRAVLKPRSGVLTGVVAVPLPICSDGLLTLISNVLALTPGTNPVHIAHDPTVIYVHVLHMRDPEASRHDVQRLADLAFRAFGEDPDAVRREAEAAS